MNTLDFASPSPSTRTTRQYTDRDKLVALDLLAQCHGNLHEAARSADIPWTTLRGWASSTIGSTPPFATKSATANSPFSIP